LFIFGLLASKKVRKNRSFYGVFDKNGKSISVINTRPKILCNDSLKTQIRKKSLKELKLLVYFKKRADYHFLLRMQRSLIAGSVKSIEFPVQ